MDIKMLKHLRIADVELFLTAAHFKNLGKAAEIHHLSQSAASTAIQRVEQALGLPLCTHEKRQFRLTQEGSTSLPRLEKWVRDLHDIFAQTAEAPLRLVTTHAIAQIILPQLINVENIDFQHLRPDLAYAAILRGEADVAIVLDNAPWKGVIATEVRSGVFQLYSKEENAPLQPVILPEEQMEVLNFEQSWSQVYQEPVPLKARIPSWSLIATICADAQVVGFLPDFLGEKFDLHPVSWQPIPSNYRMLAIYRPQGERTQTRIDGLLDLLTTCHKRKSSGTVFDTAISGNQR